MSKQRKSPAWQGWGKARDESANNDYLTLTAEKTLVKQLAEQFCIFMQETSDSLLNTVFTCQKKNNHVLAEVRSKWLAKYVPSYLLPDVIDAVTQKRKEAAV